MKKKYCKKRKKITSNNVFIYINQYSTTIKILNKNNKLIFNNTLSIGYEYIIYDLQVMFHICYKDAKKLFMQYDSLLSHNYEKIELPALGDKDILRNISTEHIKVVIYARIEEFLHLIKDKVKQNGYSRFFDKITICNNFNFLELKELSNHIFYTKNISFEKNHLEDKYTEIIDSYKYRLPPFLRLNRIKTILGVFSYFESRTSDIIKIK